MSTNGRTSIGVLIARVTFEAHSTAAFEVAGLDDVEASELLLGLRVRPVDGADPAVRRADDARFARFAQPAAEDQGIRRSHLTLEAVDLFEPATHVLFGHRLANLARGHVDGQKVPAHR